MKLRDQISKTFAPLPKFGRLKNTWLMLGIMVIAGICEGFGLALFIPIIEQIGMKGDESWIFSALRKIFSFVAVEVNLFNTLILLSTLIIGAFGLSYLKSRLLIMAKYDCITSLRRLVFEQYLNANWQYISTQAHGELINYLTMECLRYGQVLAYRIQIAAAMILIVLYAAVGALIAWDLLLIVFVLGMLLFFVLRPLFMYAKKLGAETTQANRNFSFHTLEFLKSAKLIKALSAEPAIIDRFSSVNRNLFNVSFNAENINEITYFAFQSLPVLTLCIVIFVSSKIFGTTPAFILTFLLIMARLLPRFTHLQQLYHQYLLRRPATIVIDDILVQSHANEESITTEGLTFSELKHGIEFFGVNFCYPGESKGALHDVNLSINRNDFVALVGVSGGGKSTLVDLLVGLRQPDQGVIKIDGNDLKNINLHSWRQRIGYVTQETTIFNDTVRNNLLFANPSATESDLKEALRISLMEDVVAQLPNGFDTILGESGTRLSGGQKQRLALARALIRKPELLILDEATSALDYESEGFIQKTLENLSDRMTILIVAHRLSTVRKADKIFVLEEGCVIESGSYEQLLQNKGRFSEFHEMHLR